MKIIYIPDETLVNVSIKNDDPLLLLVSYDYETLILSNIDEAFEHIILLRKAGFSDTDLDKYFRLVVNKNGADWTFVCPGDYKGITDRKKRIETFFNDGIEIISKALKLIGYDVEITIPQRYKRHFNTLSDNSSNKS